MNIHKLYIVITIKTLHTGLSVMVQGDAIFYPGKSCAVVIDI